MFFLIEIRVKDDMVRCSKFEVSRSGLRLTHTLVRGVPCSELFQFYCMIRGSKFEVRSFAMRVARFLSNRGEGGRKNFGLDGFKKKVHSS